MCQMSRQWQPVALPLRTLYAEIAEWKQVLRFAQDDKRMGLGL
jgi:hypothetical protein